jgi:hypothetical protein
MKVNKNIIKRWVEALRSGKYRQVTGSLRKDDRNTQGEACNTGFCCLGVLTDMYIKEHKQDDTKSGRWVFRLTKQDKKKKSTALYTPYKRWLYVNGGEQGDFLPDAVMQWAGFDTNNPHGKRSNDDPRHTSSLEEWDALSEFNDGGWGFDEIADMIEESYLS